MFDINFVQIDQLEKSRKIGKGDFLIEKRVIFGTYCIYRKLLGQSYSNLHTNFMCICSNINAVSFLRKKSVDFLTQVNGTQRNSHQSEHVFREKKMTTLLWNFFKKVDNICHKFPSLLLTIIYIHKKIT